MSARLLVLGLLSKADMHGYEVRKVIAQNRMDLWSGVQPGSIYHALNQMAKEGLVTLRSTEQSGNRTRAIYSVTEAGRAEFKRLLFEQLKLPPRSLPVSFYNALVFLEAIPAAEVLAALEIQMNALQAEITLWRESRPLKGSLPPHQAAAFDNGLEHLEIDLRMLQRLQPLFRQAAASDGTIGDVSS